MTARELIELLKQFDGELPVYGVLDDGEAFDLTDVSEDNGAVVIEGMSA
jgi:hypothetical protein